MLGKLKRLFSRIRDSEEISFEQTEPRNVEERSRQALTYLVNDYYEAQKRSEEQKKKLESMNLLKRLIYLLYIRLLKSFSGFVDIVAKPTGIILFSFSGAVSLISATAFMWQIAKIVNATVFFPFNIPVIFVIANCIIFSPFIASFELYSYRMRNREKRILREEYGIKV